MYTVCKGHYRSSQSSEFWRKSKAVQKTTLKFASYKTIYIAVDWFQEWRHLTKIQSFVDWQISILRPVFQHSKDQQMCMVEHSGKNNHSLSENAFLNRQHLKLPSHLHLYVPDTMVCTYKYMNQLTSLQPFNLSNNTWHIWHDIYNLVGPFGGDESQITRLSSLPHHFISILNITMW